MLKMVLAIFITATLLSGCAGQNLTGNKMLPTEVGEAGIPRYCNNEQGKMKNLVIKWPETFYVNDDVFHLTVYSDRIEDLEWANRIHFTVLAIDNNCVITQSVNKTIVNPGVGFKSFKFELANEPDSYVYYRWNMDM